MVKKMKSEDMWAVWNNNVGFYVDTRLSRQDMIDKHTSDLGMTWDECQKAGDKVVPVVITAAQQKHVWTLCLWAWLKNNLGSTAF